MRPIDKAMERERVDAELATLFSTYCVVCLVGKSACCAPCKRKYRALIDERGEDVTHDELRAMAMSVRPDPEWGW